MRKIYITGPTKGFPDGNAESFVDAAEALRQEGFAVTSPHEDEAPDTSTRVERSIEGVLAADGVALLEDWERSPAATIEALTARSAGIPARPVRDFVKGLAFRAGAAVVGLYFMATTVALAGQGDEIVEATGAIGGDSLAEIAEAYVETVYEAGEELTSTPAPEPEPSH